MASLFDGLDFTPSSSTNWGDFYKSTVDPFAEARDALANYQLPRGERNVTLPNGDVIAPSGSASLDFMRGVLGVGPTDDRAKTVEGESVPAGAGGGFDLGPLIGRAAVIVAGFIFVAAGLAMFRPGVTLVASAKSLGDGLAKGAAIG